MRYDASWTCRDESSRGEEQEEAAEGIAVHGHSPPSFPTPPRSPAPTRTARRFARSRDGFFNAAKGEGVEEEEEHSVRNVHTIVDDDIGRGGVDGGRLRELGAAACDGSRGEVEGNEENMASSLSIARLPRVRALRCCSTVEEGHGQLRELWP